MAGRFPQRTRLRKHPRTHRGIMRGRDPQDRRARRFRRTPGCSRPLCAGVRRSRIGPGCASRAFHRGLRRHRAEHFAQAVFGVHGRSRHGDLLYFVFGLRSDHPIHVETGGRRPPRLHRSLGWARVRTREVGDAPCFGGGRVRRAPVEFPRALDQGTGSQGSCDFGARSAHGRSAGRGRRNGGPGRPMPCGVGICVGCVVGRSDGGYSRTCVDGPVYQAGEVRW